MEAAEKIFEGHFDHIIEDEPEMKHPKATKETSRMVVCIISLRMKLIRSPLDP